MNNVMTIDGQKAVIQYDPEIEMFRGEFTGLTGGADFYAADVAGLKAEAKVSLTSYLDMCKQRNLEPYKTFSGKFNVRIEPALHAEIVAVAAAEGISLNELVSIALEEHKLQAA